LRPGAHIILVSAARLYTPLILLFALTLAAARAPGGGVGFMMGLAFALAFVLHGLVFGAEGLRAAFPAMAMRLLLAAGILVTLAGAGAPALRFSAQAVEAGLAVTTASAASLVVTVLFGRPPTLRDADW
jgi:hypothetical protein